MRHNLSVNHDIEIAGERGNSKIKQLPFETTEISEGSYPKWFSGYFLELSQGELEEIRSASKVAVGFQEKPYILDHIHSDGAFTVHREWLDDTESFLLQRTFVIEHRSLI